MRHAIGIIVFFVGVGFTILLGSSYQAWGILMFLDLPTLISLVFVNAAVIIMTGNFRVGIRGKNALISKKYVISR